VSAAVRFLPQQVAPIAFGVIISGLMSLLVTGIATAKALGLGDGFHAAWMDAWRLAWPIACTAILILGPLVRRLVARMTLPPEGGD
jgi:hypothetical protein